MRQLKIIICFLIMMGAVVGLKAQKTYTSEQKQFQNSVMAHLRAEGFIPSIDEDGDITFKAEGISYWIVIEDSSPFYVRFFRFGSWPEGRSERSVLSACNHVTKEVKSVKAIMYNETSKAVSLRVENYHHSAKSFTDTFSRNLRVLKYASEKLKEYYDEH